MMGQAISRSAQQVLLGLAALMVARPAPGQPAYSPVERDVLPVPNQYARINMVHTGQGRQVIYSKLERIRLNTLAFPGVPLNAVVQSLNEEARKRDPDKKGINFIVSANVDPLPAPRPTVDPQTALPEAGAPPETVDIGAIQIRIDPPLWDISLLHTLDVIVKVAERPLKYSVEDYGVIFSFRTKEIPPLYTRFFRIDPNSFYNGMQAVTAHDFGSRRGGQQSAGRVSLLSEVTIAATLIPMIQTYFRTAGVSLDPPKSVFFNDRLSLLVVRGTLQDLDIVEQAMALTRVWGGSGPALRMVVADWLGPTLLLAWPATATGFVLQQTTSLSPPAWTNVATSPNVAGNELQVLIPIPGRQTYFRLTRP